MFADTELAALDVPEVYQRHQASNAAAAAYERCYTSAVLMRRSSYPDVAAAPFYPLDDLALPCSALSEHRHPSPYPVYDRSYVDAPPSSSFLYNAAAAAAAYDCAYVGCPDCVDPGGYSSTPVGGRSSADDEDDDDEGAPSTPSSSALRRAGSLRKRSLSQAELERRRSLANHQERRRMHRLNSALDRLRSAIPPRLQNGSRRLSKIKTLKMAISYIVELQAVLAPAAAANGGGGTGSSGARSWN
ncbi:uncharacterized protein LOC144152309 [Haemaphysalis longicornis]